MMSKTKQHFDVYSSTEKSGRHFLVCSGFVLLLMLFLFMACDRMNIFSRPHVAMVNGSPIYLDDYQALLNKKMQMLPQDFKNQPDLMKKFEEEVLESMITEKIMDLRAKELNLSVSDDELENKIQEIKKDYGDDFTALFVRENIHYEKWKEDFRKEMLLQKLIEKDVNSKIRISDAEAVKYFNEHRNNYKTESRARVAQIVVRDLPTAQKAMARLSAGEDFAGVAADMSIGPEASRGGDLGFITKWVMPDPLDKTIFKMQIDKISPVVQSSYGFHIFKVIDIQQAKEGRFADVRDDVITDMRLQREDAAFINWLEELKQKAVIKKETDIKVNKPKK